MRVFVLALLLLGCEGKQPVYDRPIADCVEMKDLLKNRPYPPAHGVHSYQKGVPLCETK